jgi:hypothetical protein
MDVLEMAMMVLMPRSAWYAWRYHMAEKSPVVQPSRQRDVLTMALFHTERERQKSLVLADRCCDWHDVLGLSGLLFEHDEERQMRVHGLG